MKCHAACTTLNRTEPTTMKNPITAAIAVLSFGCAALFADGNDAKSGEIGLLCSNGMKAVVEEARPQIERAIGLPPSMEFSPTASFKEKSDAAATIECA